MASGRINGSCNGSSGSKYNFWIDWSSTVIAGTNTSNLTATAYLQRNDGYNQSAWNRDIPKSAKWLKVWADLYPSTTNGIDTRNKAKVIIASKSGYIVKHDKNGYATVTLSASFPKVADSLTGGYAKGDVSLDHIDQKPPKITYFNAYALSQTEIKTDWKADVEIGKVQYSVGTGFKDYDGVKITGLNPNERYWTGIRVFKKGTDLWTKSDVIIVKTLPIYVTSIGLPKEITAEIGNPLSIPISIKPTDASIKKLDFVSSDKSVFEIVDGKIIAHKNGIATLTAKATDGSNLTETSKITCIQRVTGIDVPTKIINVPKGQTARLSYTVLPKTATDKTVKIIADFPEIVQLIGNTVTGLENGTSNVTITTNDGGFSETVTVNVTGDYIWYDYSSYIDILNYWDVNHIYTNMQTLRSMIIEKNIPLDVLHEIDTSYNTQYVEMFDILQNTEYNLDILNNTEFESAYYIEPHQVGDFAEDKTDIYRWIQCLNDMHEMLLGNVGKWGNLLCTDGFPTIDGKRLLVRSDV